MSGIVITREFIVRGRYKTSGWTKRQLAAVGVDWPPKHGWIDRIIGREISPEKAHEFLTSGKHHPELL